MKLLRTLFVIRALWVGIKHAWWINTHRGPWPVSRFDPALDGVHDDGLALQRAINVAAMRGGGTVATGPKLLLRREIDLRGKS